MLPLSGCDAERAGASALASPSPRACALGQEPRFLVVSSAQRRLMWFDEQRHLGVVVRWRGEETYYGMNERQRRPLHSTHLAAGPRIQNELWAALAEDASASRVRWIG